jgi:hypothetical protein
MRPRSCVDSKTMITLYPSVRAIFEEYLIIFFIPQILRSENLLTLTAFRLGFFKTCNDGWFWSLTIWNIGIVEPFKKSGDNDEN